ncbi:RlmI/RlmK family 23S rRNA methyltransferase, partial [Candidatus Pacearchaeota archaeon]
KAFRLVFSEGDFLPGIIIDVFDKVIVVQLYTLGMEKLKNFIISALKNLLTPEVIVFKNDSSKRKEEGLELYTEVVEGNLKDPVLIEIDEIKFLIPIINGQKTGFFLDQRENRRFIRKLSQDMIVLDVFSYIGGFSFYALKGGAKRAFLIDRSELALNVAEEIAKINGWKDKIIIVKSDAFKVLKDPPESNLIILDPPAFIKSKKDIDLGIKKYEKLYFLGLKNLQKGLFFPFSCSYFLKMDTFWKMIIKELIKLRINGKIIYQGFQAFDHPINPNVEETFYLKGLGIWVE